MGTNACPFSFEDNGVYRDEVLCYLYKREFDEDFDGFTYLVDEAKVSFVKSFDERWLMGEYRIEEMMHEDGRFVGFLEDAFQSYDEEEELDDTDFIGDI